MCGKLTKEEFPSMLAELYERSFQPCHFKSGFHKCGLHPLDRKAISSSKLSKSIPFTGNSSSELTDQSTGDSMEKQSGGQNEKEQCQEQNGQDKEQDEEEQYQPSEEDVAYDNRNKESDVVINLKGTVVE